MQRTEAMSAMLEQMGLHGDPFDPGAVEHQQRLRDRDDTVIHRMGEEQRWCAGIKAVRRIVAIEHSGRWLGPDQIVYRVCRIETGGLERGHGIHQSGEIRPGRQAVGVVDGRIDRVGMADREHSGEVPPAEKPIVPSRAGSMP